KSSTTTFWRNFEIFFRILKLTSTTGDSLFIVVPYEKNGVKKIIFLESSKDEKRTKEKLIHDGSQSNKYKLQKTSE
ncbi:hypothetical protein ABXM56_11540, partial [Enterococcus faecium]